jgi:hypothetical protein
VRQDPDPADAGVKDRDTWHFADQPLKELRWTTSDLGLRPPKFAAVADGAG